MMSNLSEEEKKALEILKKESTRGYCYRNIDVKLSVDIVLELIDKLQKEIEELKNTETYKLAIIDKEKYVSKDKIRSLLKQVNASLYHFKGSEKNNIIQRIKDRLEELLEEE